MHARPTPDPIRPGQESVWDYPRPPALRRCPDLVQIHLGGVLIGETTESWQVLETSHPPTYYLPAAAFADGVLRPAAGGSFCEWKGAARYLDVLGGDRIAAGAAWSYPQPSTSFAAIRDHVALYAGRMDSVTVGGERVVPQPGGFYGGWITSAVIGPFKGDPGTNFW